MAGDRKRGFIRPDEDDAMIEPQRWGLPDYGEPKAKQAKQTAFNYDPGWVPNFDEPEEEQVLDAAETKGKNDKTIDSTYDSVEK